ncbi:MAG: 4'-phosphopantetheinyl transferase superfamily protein [Flavobacteriaceae bacterium]|nr:4'-phosphopantetheinyl transferase superfamily protein [Flavobacteriaceae bacterium]
MPLFKTIKPNEDTLVLVWKIKENLSFLEGIFLRDISLKRVNGMKSEIHKKGFLSIRHLLATLNYSDADLFYTSDGKPHLKNGKYISITHSFNFSAIIISNNVVGIDIEKNREKIIKISNKFLGDEKKYLVEKNLVEQLTIIWGAKESLYKIYPNGGLLFKHHLPIEKFTLKDKKTRGWIKKDNFYEVYTIFFYQIEDFTLVYALNQHQTTR